MVVDGRWPPRTSASVAPPWTASGLLCAQYCPKLHGSRPVAPPCRSEIGWLHAGTRPLCDCEHCPRWVAGDGRGLPSSAKRHRRSLICRTRLMRSCLNLCCWTDTGPMIKQVWALVVHSQLHLPNTLLVVLTMRWPVADWCNAFSRPTLLLPPCGLLALKRPMWHQPVQRGCPWRCPGWPASVLHVHLWKHAHWRVVCIHIMKT